MKTAKKFLVIPLIARIKKYLSKLHNILVNDIVIDTGYDKWVYDLIQKYLLCWGSSIYYNVGTYALLKCFVLKELIGLKRLHIIYLGMSCKSFLEVFVSL